MKNTLLKILMLEDDEMDAELILMFLRKTYLDVAFTLVSTKEDYIKALDNDDFDAIISDHNLPQFSSIQALQIRNQKKIDIPFILVSGAIPEEYAVALLQEGANDYILKDRPQRLPTAIEQAIKKQKIVAEKLKAERELAISNERFELAAKASFDLIWDYDLSEKKIIFSEAFEKVYGYETSDFTNPYTLYQIIHPDDFIYVNNGLQKLLQSNNDRWSSFFRIKKADGSIAQVKQNVIVLRDQKGLAYRAVGVIEDISTLHELENQLSEQKLSRLKEITEISIKAQEKERTEIGQELHDNVNQLLASSKMMIEAAMRSPEMHDLCIKKSLEAINLAITEVRNISHIMITPSLEDDEFISSLTEMIENINLSGKVKVKMNVLKEELQYTDNDIKLTIYRIIQEQLNNILKHAEASEVELVLQKGEYQMMVMIKDNGKGFNPTERKHGIGLTNIRNRAELHQGKVHITSSPGEGCIMKIDFPAQALVINQNSLLKAVNE